ncbi:hypothetical protein PISMIDRAFT_121254, partial [Pisolithus microcarpus 441]
AKLDEECACLIWGCCKIWSFVFPRTDSLIPHLAPRPRPVNWHHIHIIQSATRCFHIVHRKSNDFNLVGTDESFPELQADLPAVLGEDELSMEVQVDASLTFCMHVRATLATRRILEEFRPNHEAFEWV